MMVTEEEVRAWVRDEQEKILLERQAACSHAISGTLVTETEDWKVKCSECGKMIDDWEETGPSVMFNRREGS